MSEALEPRLDIEVLKQFRIIFKSVRRHFQSVEQVCGISGAQLWALARIAQTPNITVGQLAQELVIHQSTTSNLIERLAAKKLITRLRVNEDQRVVSLAPTELGLETVNRAPQPYKGLLPDALGNLSASQLRDLNELLNGLLQVMAKIEIDGATSLLGGDE